MDMREAIIAQTSFSLRLSTHLLSSSNLAFSPLSLHSLLGLLAAGSSGPTHHQLLSFLGSPVASDLAALHSQISNFILADGSAAGGPCLRYAGGVWADASTNLKNSFREVAGSVYKAEAHSVPFRSMPEECRNQINNWVEQMTAGKIKELLPFRSVKEETRLILGNAMYFNGSWDAKFDPLYTKINTFHLIDGNSVETPFMTSSKKQFIAVYDGFKVLKLPYKQGQDFRQFSFCIFLPDASNALPNLSMKMCSEPDFINRHIPTEKVLVGNFRIPKFKISMGIEFSEILKNLGLVLPFTMTGDLSEMVDSSEASQYYVSQIVHKCFIEVNEEGTEAAAASAAILMFGCALPIGEPIDFVADHPFLFFIRDDRSGVVLFMGYLLNPLLAE
ncbi:Serpin family protein [Rhynchospora pubera]|uniref:Serpin family protein n=1 Tax=Rhynchospora pubera TaxID=906938 RepID=A0AAV8CER8_9POAL|nr:Serpin family protein [Rhynchospora pubera]